MYIPAMSCSFCVFSKMSFISLRKNKRVALLTLSMFQQYLFTLMTFASLLLVIVAFPGHTQQVIIHTVFHSFSIVYLPLAFFGVPLIEIQSFACSPPGIFSV